MGAALPSLNDPADLLPSKDFINVQDSAEADVFFLHPTTYLKDKKENNWNGDVQNQALNERTDNSSIKYQASILMVLGGYLHLVIDRRIITPILRMKQKQALPGRPFK